MAARQWQGLCVRPGMGKLGAGMKCLVTAGPTFEPLDRVRRLTNFATGRLGSELARLLASQGHTVILLRGAGATWGGGVAPDAVFTTTADLEKQLAALAGPAMDAIFHTAAVCDFTVRRAWRGQPDGQWTEETSGKWTTRGGPLRVELVPTPKLIGRLRVWFPRARIAGWKFEVEGDRATALTRAEEQIAEFGTHGCVANGPAYGEGFGWVTGPGRHQHQADAAALFATLAEWLMRGSGEAQGVL